MKLISILYYPVLQDKLLEAERALDEAMRKSNEERSRRRTLHNTLIVSFHVTYTFLYFYSLVCSCFSIRW